MGLILISHDLNLVSPLLRPHPGDECRRSRRGVRGGRTRQRHASLHARPARRRCRASTKPASELPVLDRSAWADMSAISYRQSRRLLRPHARSRTASSSTIAEGESFALVGESGSGKSTVLKAIAGLAPRMDRRDLGVRHSRARTASTAASPRTARWCSRTPMARCIRARRSMRRSASR